MDTNETTETEVPTETGDGEGDVETLTIPKKDYETLNQTVGSLKRELKDLKKSQEKPDKPTETPQTKPEGMGLLEKSFLRAAGISDPEEVELALSTSKKWGVDIDQVVDDEDFKVKLERHRTSKANALATSNIRGSAGPTQAKLTPEYWIQKNAPPTPADVPDRKTRASIVRAMMANAETGGKKFYND